MHRQTRVRASYLGICLAVVGLNVIAAAAVPRHAAEILIVAVAVPVMLALLQRPQRGILLLIIGVPLSGILILVPHAGAAEAWKQFIVLLMLAGSFLDSSEGAHRRTKTSPSWVIGLVPLLALGLVSGVIVGPTRAFYGLREYFFYVLLAWAIWRCPPNGKERDRIVTALMVIGVLEGFYALFEQYLGPVRLNRLGYAYNDTITFIGPLLRSFGTFKQPFGFGFFEMLVLLVGLPHALSERSRPRSQWFLVLMPVCVLGLATSVVRGAILGFAVGIAYLGFARYRVLLLTVPAALVLVLLLPARVVAPAFSSSSSQQRVSGWGANVHRITVHPFGIGIGATGSAAAKVQARGPQSVVTKQSSTYEPDNSWFKILLELGAIGLWLFALVVMAIASSTHQAARAMSGADAAFARGVTAMVLAAMAAAFFSSYFDLFPMDMLFWMLVGVVSGMDNEAGANSGVPMLNSVQ